mgnify:CR=1 FL=1
MLGSLLLTVIETVGGLLTGACLTMLPLTALADPALIFDLGGKFDKSFNEAAYAGAERWKAETGGSYKELEMQSEAQREQALRRLAETGANPIVMTGFAFGEVLNKVAKDYPDTKFVIIDMVVEQPNVQSVVFAEPEGSYLAGVMAAKASKSGTVSFVGGMDVPLIHKFECGYAQGVKATNPDAKVLINYTGTTPAAWNDPVKGGELAQMSRIWGSRRAGPYGDPSEWTPLYLRAERLSGGLCFCYRSGEPCKGGNGAL